MSSSAINQSVFQAKIGSVQNDADSSAVYSAGVWSFKNSTAVTGVTITNAGRVGVLATSPRGVLDLNTTREAKIYLGTAGVIGETQSNAGDYIANNLFVSAETAGTMTYTKTTADSGNAIVQDFSRGIAFYSGVTGAASSTGTLNNFERMRIDAVGALTVGSSGSTISHTIQAPSNPAGTAAVHVRKQNVAINSGGNSYIEFYGASGGYDGYLGVTGTTLTVIDASDSRKKENVRPANYGLKEIKELKPVVYDWKEEFGGEKDVKGFLAQEVKQVLPECVTIKDETDAGGFSDSHFLGTANMIPVLVAAIQELSAKVDAQAAEIEALKAKP